MKIARDWTDYEIITAGEGMKLERWGNIYLLRPDPQVIWQSKVNMRAFPELNAVYNRSDTGGGGWEAIKKLPKKWNISYKGMTLSVSPTGFKHTGVFPEQATNWDMMDRLIRGAKRPIRVLNLFGYTGAASVRCALSGADVTHVDASKGMCERAGENARQNGITNIRYIIDDCAKFVSKEIKRGKSYDAIIMDPPSYGRGPNGEMWKLESNLCSFLQLTKGVLSKNPLFFLLNSYTTGLQPAALYSLTKSVLGVDAVEAYEVGLPISDGLVLPCGASALVLF